MGIMGGNGDNVVAAAAGEFVCINGFATNLDITSGGVGVFLLRCCCCCTALFLFVVTFALFGSEKIFPKTVANWVLKLASVLGEDGG